MTLLAQDTFVGRTITTTTNSWGTASDGNTWAKLHGNGANPTLSVASGEGNAHSGSTDCQMLLGSGTATDQEGLAHLAVGQSGDSIGVVLRSDATGGTYYYSEIGNFTNDITIYKVVAGTKTNLNIFASGITISVGSFYWIRFQVVGISLKCRIWASGGTEPGTWTGTVTDSSIASGQYGLFINSFGAVDAQFDSYQANDTVAAPPPSLPASAVTAMPIISRNVPAYTNDDFSGSFPASNANNAIYFSTNMWRCAQTPVANADSGTLIAPVYLAYDLSGVSSAQRQNVVLVWYNDPQADPYNPALIGTNYANTPASYTIDTNTAAGGGVAPTTGWITVATVTNQPYHSRQHAFNLAGANWVRINVTAINGSVSNNNCAMNMDVHDAHSANADNWIFFGDSITSQAFDHDDSNMTGGTLPAQIAAVYNNVPIMEDGGIGGYTSADAVANISTWLALFSGKYVGLNYGTNDANGGGAATTNYQANMESLINTVIGAGKIPVIHKTIPFGTTTGITTNGPTINAALATLFALHPSVIQGPDLWAYYQANPTLISGDGIHPTLYAGYIAYRQQWATTLLNSVYKVSLKLYMIRAKRHTFAHLV